MQERSERRSSNQRNVFGDPLASCSEQPLTGFYRSGCCHTGPEDVGLHTVCVEVTRNFWRFPRQGATICRRRDRSDFPD